MEQLDVVNERVLMMEYTLERLVELRTSKDWYSIGEAAHLLGKAEFTVREWCRLGRVCVEKKGSGRGKYQG